MDSRPNVDDFDTDDDDDVTSMNGSVGNEADDDYDDDDDDDDEDDGDTDVVDRSSRELSPDIEIGGGDKRDETQQTVECNRTLPDKLTKPVGLDLVGPALAGPVLDGSVRVGPVLDGSVLNGSLLAGSVFDEPVLDGSVRVGPVLDDNFDLVYPESGLDNQDDISDEYIVTTPAVQPTEAGDCDERDTDVSGDIGQVTTYDGNFSDTQHKQVEERPKVHLIAVAVSSSSSSVQLTDSEGDRSTNTQSNSPNLLQTESELNEQKLKENLQKEKENRNGEFELSKLPGGNDPATDWFESSEMMGGMEPSLVLDERSATIDYNESPYRMRGGLIKISEMSLEEEPCNEGVPDMKDSVRIYEMNTCDDVPNSVIATPTNQDNCGHLSQDNRGHLSQDNSDHHSQDNRGHHSQDNRDLHSQVNRGHHSQAGDSSKVEVLCEKSDVHKVEKENCADTGVRRGRSDGTDTMYKQTTDERRLREKPDARDSDVTILNMNNLESNEEESVVSTEAIRGSDNEFEDDYEIHPASFNDDDIDELLLAECITNDDVITACRLQTDVTPQVEGLFDDMYQSKGDVISYKEEVEESIMSSAEAEKEGGDRGGAKQGYDYKGSKSVSAVHILHQSKSDLTSYKDEGSTISSVQLDEEGEYEGGVGGRKSGDLKGGSCKTSAVAISQHSEQKHEPTRDTRVSEKREVVKLTDTKEGGDAGQGGSAVPGGDKVPGGSAVPGWDTVPGGSAVPGGDAVLVQRSGKFSLVSKASLAPSERHLARPLTEASLYSRWDNEPVQSSPVSAKYGGAARYLSSKQKMTKQSVARLSRPVRRQVTSPDRGDNNQLRGGTEQAKELPMKSGFVRPLLPLVKGFNNLSFLICIDIVSNYCPSTLLHYGSE